MYISEHVIVLSKFCISCIYCLCFTLYNACMYFFFPFCNWIFILFSDGFLVNPLDPTSYDCQDTVDLAKDSFSTDEVQLTKTIGYTTQKTHNYVPQSAVALRCRVMPPPCIKNPYQKDASEMDIDRFGNQWAKCAGVVLIFMLFSRTFCFIFPLLLLRQMLPQKKVIGILRLEVLIG